MSSSYPYATTHDVLRGMPSEGRSRDSIIAELEAFAHDEDKTWETGQVLGHDVLRRPHALRVPRPRVRALRAHERAPARHVPEHDEVRGRDHRDDARHAPRRRGHRRRARRARHVRRQRQHPARGARVPRVRATAARHRPAELRQARDRASRVRQGVPPARGRVPARAGRPRDHAPPTSTRWRS